MSSDEGGEKEGEEVKWRKENDGEEMDEVIKVWMCWMTRKERETVKKK